LAASELGHTSIWVSAIVSPLAQTQIDTVIEAAVDAGIT
jgi:hypothetical protein